METSKHSGLVTMSATVAVWIYWAGPAFAEASLDLQGSLQVRPIELIQESSSDLGLIVEFEQIASAPVLTVPEGGPIAARPRREGLYDTEAFCGAGSVCTYPLIPDTHSFAVPNGVLRVLEVDTNLVGNGGSPPRGHYLRVFGSQAFGSSRKGGDGAHESSSR